MVPLLEQYFFSKTSWHSAVIAVVIASVLYQLGRDVTYSRRFSCLQAHFHLQICLKYGRTFVVCSWSGIVLIETGVWYKRVVIEVIQYT
ncbi:hypothetical protein DPMN_133155 [Dreissena polymorpha]|uniref:Uncharacterized protein n=1 Tax=Dreissena polymorpha TaxID=45954 RepID=A0A9D4FTT1_DREPO|nr:hypothetical protein DPMN_133155 [Dreissena polymorpha]